MCNVTKPGEGNISLWSLCVNALGEALSSQDGGKG